MQETNQIQILEEENKKLEEELARSKVQLEQLKRETKSILDKSSVIQNNLEDEVKCLKDDKDKLKKQIRDLKLELSYFKAIKDANQEQASTLFEKMKDNKNKYEELCNEVENVKKQYEDIRNKTLEMKKNYEEKFGEFLKTI